MSFLFVFCFLFSLLFCFLSKSKHLLTSQMCYPSHRKKLQIPFLDILGYLKNTHKNPKFGRVRQFPTRELGWEFPGWDLSHFAKFGIFTLKYQIMGICYFFLCPIAPCTGKNNRFPFLDILGYLNNTNKNPKFGKERQVPTKFPGWDLSHSSKFGIFVGIL